MGEWANGRVGVWACGRNATHVGLRDQIATYATHGTYGSVTLVPCVS
jgi:hypothetical protein